VPTNLGPLRSLSTTDSLELPRLPVHGVCPAPRAVLLQLEPVFRVSLVLRCHIVASLALRAGERDRRTFVGCHVFLPI